MIQIMRQFEPFDYKAVVITKLDETNRIGNAISALAERGKSVSYITNGQSVPQNIERARVTRLLMNLEGFRVDRPRLEARYGEEAEESGAGRTPATEHQRAARRPSRGLELKMEDQAQAFREIMGKKRLRAVEKRDAASSEHGQEDADHRRRLGQGRASERRTSR